MVRYIYCKFCNEVSVRKKVQVCYALHGSILSMYFKNVFYCMEKLYFASFNLQFTDSPVLAVCSDSGGSVFELEFK